MALSKVGSNQIDSAATPTFAELDVDNVKVNGNTISSTDTNGNVNIDPAGTGDTVMTGSGGQVTVDENGHITSKQSLDTATAGGRLVGASNRGTVGQIELSQTTSSADGGYIRFLTCASGSTSPTERVRVDQSGFVGIGESAPKKMVHITKNDSDGLIILDADGATTDHQICFSKDYGTGGTSGGNYWGIGVDGSENKLVFAYDPNAQASLSADAKVVLNSSGNLLIGGTGAVINADSKLGVHGRIDASTSGTTPLSLNRSGSDGVIIDFLNDGSAGIGNVSVSGSNVAFNTSSDYRLKEAVVDMTGAIDRVKQLAPKRFNFIRDADKVFDGFLAHEAQAVVPEAVTGTKDEVDEDGNAVMQGIDQSKLVPLLVGALKESIAKIETLETKVAALEAG